MVLVVAIITTAAIAVISCCKMCYLIRLTASFPGQPG